MAKMKQRYPSPAPASSHALPEFSEVVASKAESLRNIAAQGDLDIWLGDILADKIGTSASAEGQAANPRHEKTKQWTVSVAKKRMAREGAIRPALSEELELLAQEEPWVETAIEKGKKLSFLSLNADEGDELRAMLDWMRSPSGPSVDSDWSRISWQQALSAHHLWVKELTRAAQKNMLASTAFDGCALLAPVVDTPELEGWSWVEVQSKAALDREGALMKHCVGSYSDVVVQGKVRIASLRDPAGSPHLTSEARVLPGTKELRVEQIKGVANSHPKALHMMALPSMLEGFKATNAAVGIAPHLLGASLPGILYAPKDFGEPRRLWRMGHPGDARAALPIVQSSMQSADADQILPIADFLKSQRYQVALDLFLASPRTAMAYLAVEAQRENDPDTIAIPQGAQRFDLMALRDDAAARAMPNTIRACLLALRELPTSAFASRAHQSAELASLDRFEHCLEASNDLVDEMTLTASSMPKETSQPEKSTAFHDAIKSSKALAELARLLGNTRDRTVHAICGYLNSALPKRVERTRSYDAPPMEEAKIVSDSYRGMGVAENAIKVSIHNDFRTALAARLLKLGDFDSTGRAALISGITGFGQVDPQRSAKLWEAEEVALLAMLATEAPASAAPVAAKKAPGSAAVAMASEDIKDKIRSRKAKSPKTAKLDAFDGGIASKKAENP